MYVRLVVRVKVRSRVRIRVTCFVVTEGHKGVLGCGWKGDCAVMLGGDFVT